MELVRERQTDRQAGEQDPRCSLVGRLHNNVDLTQATEASSAMR